MAVDVAFQKVTLAILGVNRHLSTDLLTPVAVSDKFVISLLSSSRALFTSGGDSSTQIRDTGRSERVLKQRQEIRQHILENPELRVF